MVSNIEPLLLGINDAAKMLGLSRTKLYELIAEKRIPLVKIGRSSRVPLPGLKAFTDSLNKIAA